MVLRVRCIEAEKEMASYPIRSVTFQTERVFLDHHPDLASHWGLVEDEETETWLGREIEHHMLWIPVQMSRCSFS